jgi:hypothetical protein
MSILDKIQLPESSAKEELEELSRDKLKPLFPKELFQVRDEIYRDKGLDLTIELKYKNSYTHFKFLVQLKATESKEKNKDGSYSWQIDTSNIQYLLNGGLPAYYICYVKQTDTFYYKQLNDFVNEINSKSNNWNKQDSHTLRINSILDTISIKKIYDDVRKRCEKYRELTEKLNIGIFENKKVSITSDYNITDESSIVKLIEDIGTDIINRGRSHDIILLSKKVSDDITSPVFNLNVGVANYNTSNLFGALAYLNKAQKQKDKLSIGQVNCLNYFYAVVEYSIGLINEEEYLSILQDLESFGVLSGYAKIEKIKYSYIENIENETSFRTFCEEIFEIINDKNNESNVRLIAKCEYLFYWGSKINMVQLQSVFIINGLEENMGANLELRKQNAQQWHQDYQEWDNFRQELIEEIDTSKNNIILNQYMLNVVKVQFELIVQRTIFDYEKEIPGYPSFKDLDISNDLNSSLENLDIVANNYEKMCHVQNLVAALATKYEILKFMKNEIQMKTTESRIMKLIDFHDLKEDRRKFNLILNGEGMEDSLRKHKDAVVSKIRSDKDGMEKIMNEIEKYDKEENNNKVESKDEQVCVHLFPIGYFSVPKNQLDEFYEILKIDSYTLVKKLEYSFNNNIIPVLNILNEIQNEGYANGKLDDKGLESWLRIRDIRKALYEKGFRKRII